MAVRERFSETIGHCRHCNIGFRRPSADPTPPDRCQRCHEEIVALITQGGEAPEALGRKFDGEKPRFDLLLEGMPLALTEVVRVLTYGSRKYEDHNWQFVDRAPQRYLAAGMRHEMALAIGESHDPESGAHHLAHKLCCDLFRLELALREVPA